MKSSECNSCLLYTSQLEIEKQALQQKYTNLVRNSVYVTSLEAADDYNNRNKLASFRYVDLPYSSILDANVKICLLYTSRCV